jgi:superfamily II DNA or RNA helicase
MHTTLLAALLCLRGIEAASLHGKMNKAQQEEVLGKLRSKQVQVVIATTLADKGLDIPGLDSGMLAMPTKSLGRVQQRIGRIMRDAPNKLEPEWADVVDAAPEFMAMAKQRTRRYRELGCRI